MYKSFREGIYYPLRSLGLKTIQNCIALKNKNVLIQSKYYVLLCIFDLLSEKGFPSGKVDHLGNSANDVNFQALQLA